MLTRIGGRVRGGLLPNSAANFKILGMLFLCLEPSFPLCKMEITKVLTSQGL